MSAAAQVSVAEYLASSYRPDREYLEGSIEERNIGEFDHSRLQFLIAMALGAQEQRLGVYVLTEQRVQVRAERFRVPDICVIRRADKEKIVRRAPLVCVEILSPEDTMTAMQQRIDDYLAFGVECVWVVDPKLRRGYIYSADGMRPALDGVLRAAELEVDLAALFGQL